MTIFFVYLNWTWILGDATVSGHVLLTCRSRYVADEFFRTLYIVKDIEGVKLFPSIAYATPWFWQFDCPPGHQHPPAHIIYVLSRRTFVTACKTQIIPKRLGPSTDRIVEWPIIPVVDGPGWLHNGSYCIRSKRRPDRYWSCHSDFVFASDWKTDKFQIQRIGFATGYSEVSKYKPY